MQAPRSADRGGAGDPTGKGVFAPLADPAFFIRVRIGGSDRSLEWPGELDFCADALWFDVHPEDAPPAINGRNTLPLDGAGIGGFSTR
jgi:hypothetical protein